MLRKSLVSIITPCYNSATYIHRLLDSVLTQDYPCIEMIAIDDGSTDNTKEIIESYIFKFQEKGYELTYLYQENAGQSAAVNRGLKLVTGEYLTWPDSDDFLRFSFSISMLVKCLSSSDRNYGLVRCQCQFLEEGTLCELEGKLSYTSNEFLFMPFIKGEEFGGGAGVYMVKMEAFDNVVIGRDIYTGRNAQNCQLLEPLFYTYKCKTINTPLINILVRKDSHSHTEKSYEGQLDDIQGYIDIHTNTINRMENLSDEERKQYLLIVNQGYLSGKIGLALNFKKYKHAREFARQLKGMGGILNRKKQLKLLLSYCPPLLVILNHFLNICKCFIKRTNRL